MSNDKFRYGGAGFLGDLVRQGGDVYSNLGNENDIKNKGPGMWGDMARNGGDVIVDHEIGGGDPVQVTYLPTVAAAPHAVYSLTKLVSGYNGPLAKVCATSDTAVPAATIDVSAGANGRADFTAAIAAYGSSFDIFELYDQTGNHANATQGTVANRTKYLAETGWGSSPFFYGVSNDHFTLPATVTVSRRAMCDFVVSGGPNQYGSGVAVGLMGHSTTNSTASYMNLLVGDRGAVGAGGSFAISEYPQGELPTVIGYNGSASASRIIRDDQVRSLTAQADVTGITGGYLGRTAASQVVDSIRLYAHIVYAATLSNSDESAVKDALKTIFSIPTRTKQLYMLGDSIVFGQASTDAKNMQYYMLPQISGNPYIINLGRSGQTALAELSVRTQQRLTDAFLPGFTKQVLYMNFGSNDINSVQDASALLANIQTLVTRAQTAGFTVVVGHVIPRPAYNGTMEASRVEYNGLLESNKVSMGITTVPFTNIEGTIQISGDNVHPTSAGYQTMANFAASYFNAALA